MREIDLMKVMDSKPLHEQEKDTWFVCKKCHVQTKTPQRGANGPVCSNCGGELEGLNRG